MTTANVVELRQYTLRPGRRDTLIDLFDREFVETQEQVGIRVLGQFRDEDDPDRFVWLRAFPDMAARRAALTAFYLDGAAWREHRDAANATMLDSDDVLLLRPHTAFPPPAAPRRPVGTNEAVDSRVVLTVCPRSTPCDAEFLDFFDRTVAPVLTAAGAPPVASFVTEPAENTFPALPVRAGETVFVWLTVFADADRRWDHVRRLARSLGWQRTVGPELTRRLSAAPQQLNLIPTARSLLR